MILFDRCSLLQQNVRLCLFVRRIGRGNKEYCSDSGSGAEESESVSVQAIENAGQVEKAVKYIILGFIKGEIHYKAGRICRIFI